LLLDKLQKFIDRYEEINDLLSQPDILSDIKQMTKLTKEQSSLSKIVQKAKEYKKVINDIQENKSLLEDKELAELAKEELKELEKQKPILEEELKILLLPKDPADDKNIYLELRAGTGGDEAAIFVGDLLRTYLKYAANKGWSVEIVDKNESEAGGFKEIICLIKGDSVYSRLKFESGTSRHTS